MVSRIRNPSERHRTGGVLLLYILTCWCVVRGHKAVNATWLKSAVDVCAASTYSAPCNIPGYCRRDKATFSSIARIYPSVTNLGIGCGFKLPDSYIPANQARNVDRIRPLTIGNDELYMISRLENTATASAFPSQLSWSL